MAALVELRPGAPADVTTLQAHVRGQLAGYKAPRAVFAVDTVNRAPNGKVDYPTLTALATRLRADA